MAKKNSYETTKHGFKLDIGKLEEVVLAVMNAVNQRTGIFANGLERFLPQWNLPEELEFDPKQRQVSDPVNAARFLWTRLFCDRLSSSRFLIQTTRTVWYDTELRWIYDPAKVIKRSEEEIDHVLRDHLKFGLDNAEKESSNAARFRNNSRRVVSEYGGEPINIVRYNAVEQSRQNLLEFEGIGTGLANLYIIELYDREIVIPRDPGEVMLKIDRHKAGISIFTGALEPTNNEIDSNLPVPVLEVAYMELCKKHRIDPRILDAALWVIGSEVCSTKDYGNCVAHCVLADRLCLSRSDYNPLTGRYIVLKGEARVETRKGSNQFHLFDMLM